MKAIIIGVGDELVSGQTVDTNSAYLSRRLAENGIITLEHRVIGDRQDAIADVIRNAAARADYVLVTGGLGPTEDDLTRQALADVMNEPLSLDPQCLADVEGFFRRLNRPMAPSNRIQAMIPRGAQAMRNEAGTAPGIKARLGQAHVYIMPGVPSEMKWMYDHCVVGELPAESGVVLHRVVHTFGQGESNVGGVIADLMKRGADPLVGTTVANGIVSIRVVSAGQTAAGAKQKSDAIVAILRDRLGTLVVGEGDDTLAGITGGLLRENAQTLATAESCTGGLIGELLTAVSGSSNYYLGGFVTYSNQLKHKLLGVPENLLAAHGAVSEPVAAAMAQGCRRTAGSAWALSATGIAGPAGATAEKPVGLVFIGLDGPNGTQVQQHVFPGARDMVRLRAALTAINMLRLELLK